jgi:hypothetical protein
MPGSNNGSNIKNRICDCFLRGASLSWKH